MSSAFQRTRRVMRKGLVLSVASLALSACITLFRDHGYIPLEEDLAALRVGVDDRESVAEAVGKPSASGVLNQGGYYYISTRVRHYGATEPKIVSRELVAISFDTRGKVSNIERFGLEDGRVITLERRVTDNGLDDGTFLRQLLGNLGRIGPGTILDN